MTLSRMCKCEVCGTEAVTQRSVLPDRWGMTWEFSYTLCDGCLKKFEERFGEKPILYLEGGEKELTLF